MRIMISLLVALGIGFLPLSLVLAQVEYSADTTLTGPKGEKQIGKIYFGNKKVRTDRNQRGQEIIQIVDENAQMMYLINVTLKQYIEQPMQVGNPKKAQQHAKPDPCAGPPGTKCSLLGKEKLAGRDVEKYEIRITPPKGKAKAYTVVSWFDRRLGVSIMDKFPNNASRSLSNIKEGKQDDSLFSVPSGFAKVTPPSQGQK